MALLLFIYFRKTYCIYEMDKENNHTVILFKDERHSHKQQQPVGFLPHWGQAIQGQAVCIFAVHQGLLCSARTTLFCSLVGCLVHPTRIKTGNKLKTSPHLYPCVDLPHCFHTLSHTISLGLSSLATGISNSHSLVV